MVERVRTALEGSRIERTWAVVSPHTPKTTAHLEQTHGSESVLETPGEGYVTDLTVALDADAIEPPVLTVAADLPVLTAATVDRILAHHEGGSMTVCVPVSVKRRLGVSVDPTLDSQLTPTGLNVVGTPNTEDMRYVSYDPKLAVNVNTIEDAQAAERYLTQQEHDQCA